MTEKQKRRAVIVTHPTFDDPVDGLDTAKDYVNKQVEGVAFIWKGAEEQGAPAKDVAELKKLLEQFEYKIVKLPVDMFK